MENELVSYKEMYNCLNLETLDIKVTSKDIVKNPIFLKDKVNENYKFIKKNIFFKVVSFIFYCFAFVVLFPLLSIFYIPKVKGKKNLKNVKNTVFVANHSFILDCALLNTHVLKFKRPFFIVNKKNMQVPVACSMIKLFKAVPIPDSIKAYKRFLYEVDTELKNKKSILIYPEGSMWPYFAKIRPFNSGAFRFSVKNNVPVIPIVLSYRKPNWLYKLLGRKKPLININILSPVYPDPNNNLKEEENKINNIVFSKMTECFSVNNSYVYINEKALKKENNKNIQN